MSRSTGDGGAILLDDINQSRDAKEDSKTEDDSSMGSYFRLFKYNDTTGWILTGIAIVCMVAAGVLLPLMNLIFGKFVNVFNDFVTGRSTPAEFRASINHYALFFVYLFVAKFVLSYIWTTLVSINAIRITRALRLDFFEHTIRQEIGYFDTDAADGSIATRISTDANLAHQGIAEKFGLTVQAITTFFAAFGVAFGVQWKMTLITMSIVPAMLLVISITVTLDMMIEKDIMEVWASADKLAEDVFATIRNVQAFWAFDLLTNKYDAQLDKARVLATRRNKRPALHAVLFSTQFFCIYAGYGLAFWQGLRMYHRGEITEPGRIVTVIFAVVLAAQGLTQIAPQIMVVSKAASSAHGLFRTIDRPSQIDPLSQDGLLPDTCRGEILLENVTFAYPSRPGVAVLDGLSLRIPANKTTAIVGPSGSGKSTVVGLLERWFTPASGTITVDGERIESLNLQWLRTNVRLVQQEPVLFSGTVFANVANGLAGTASAALQAADKMKLVHEACRAANAHEFIDKLPDGYATQIGERGALLSGGQKQRLVIARSIVANPRVLLLDEATSALDPSSESIVQQALTNIGVGRTVLVIAHRLSTIRDADNIVVMAAGKIVEQGTHDELIGLGGVYSRLVLSQDLTHGNGHGDHGILEAPAQSGIVMPVAPREPQGPLEDIEGVARTSKSKTASDHNLLKCLAIIIAEQKSLHIPFAVLGLSAAVVGGVYPAFAILFSRVVGVFALPDDTIMGRGDFYAFMFFVMALGNLVFYCILGWMSATISQAIVNNYRSVMFHSILRQPIAFFDDPANKTGALVARLASEPTALQELLSANIALILTICANLVASCILAIATGWKLGLVLVLGALPPLVGAGYVRIRLELQLDAATAARFADSANIAFEAVRAIRTVASLTLERDLLDRYGAALASIARTASRSLVVTMLWYALSQSMSFLVMALGFWYGGRLISTGEYSAQQFYVVFIAVLFSGEAAASFFMYTTSLTQAQRAANYMFDLRSGVASAYRDDQDQGERQEDVPRVGESGAVAVECDRLGFAYPSRAAVPILRDLSLAVRPGQFVAFVGASGCGKTTMISLLERFYDPTSGVLRIDGRDSRTVHPRDLRRHMSLVQQEPVLYQGSVRENIAMGAMGMADSAPSDDDIMGACQQANIDAFVQSLPDGLATLCGAQGLQFSGGQRQRIALARALLRRPRLLLLDEATSSLDTVSERLVQESLEAACAQGQQTTVAVAHRLSTVKNADAIFVFAQGRVAEVGDHEALLAKKGLYYQMCLGQSLDK